MDKQKLIDGIKTLESMKTIWYNNGKPNKTFEPSVSKLQKELEDIINTLLSTKSIKVFYVEVGDLNEKQEKLF